jgi:superfamily II DNA or RNA helicase
MFQTEALSRMSKIVMDLDTEIEEAEQKLAELDRLRAVSAERLAQLNRRRAASVHTGEGDGRSPAEKLTLFRDLFRGRTDVFALRWENQGRTRAGYSPCCANEWQRGLCGKPKVRCGACDNQAFVTLDDRQLLGHLRGHRALGIYPLLADDMCQLLAIDLDGDSWRSDASAIRRTCRSLSLEPAIERSRSGGGAHLWFFFSDAVPAADARRLGMSMLTRTMADGAALSIGSYDRLFPSQDVLPSGGFGNLIALPLQREARKLGNTEFLDNDLKPYTDQWSYLASIRKIDAAQLAELIAGFEPDGPLAVRTESEGSEAPWRPSPTLRERLTTTQLPEIVTATLADRLYFDRKTVPAPVMNAIKRLATFSNPMFLELQRMRMSVARTPRVIACFEDLDHYVAVPRGCLDDTEALLAELGVRLQIQDERVDGSQVAVAFHGDLNETQRAAAKAMLANDTGVLCAPPGWGKTVLATSLIASRGRSTIILVNRKPLVEQWVSRLAEFLAIPAKSIGRIGGGRQRLTGQIDVAMVQTLARSKDLRDLVRAYGHVVIDECHHVPAVSIERVLSAVPARHVTGLTATPYRRDGHQAIITMQCGPTRHTVRTSKLRQSEQQDLRVIRRETDFPADALPPGASIQEIYAALATDSNRLKLVAADARNLMRQGRAVIALTERRDHLDRLAEELHDDVPHLVVLHGGVKPKARRAALAHLAEPSDDRARLVLATGRYIGEGFDDPRLDTLLLAMPIAWKGTVVQYAGRLHRAHPGKRDIRIYDYVDTHVPVLRRMHAKRLRAYEDMGYTTTAQLAVQLGDRYAPVA